MQQASKKGRSEKPIKSPTGLSCLGNNERITSIDLFSLNTAAEIPPLVKMTLRKRLSFPPLLVTTSLVAGTGDVQCRPRFLLLLLHTCVHSDVCEYPCHTRTCQIHMFKFLKYDPVVSSVNTYVCVLYMHVCLCACVLLCVCVFACLLVQASLFRD